MTRLTPTPTRCVGILTSHTISSRRGPMLEPSSYMIPVGSQPELRTFLSSQCQARRWTLPTMRRNHSSKAGVRPMPPREKVFFQSVGTGKRTARRCLSYSKGSALAAETKPVVATGLTYRRSGGDR